MGLEERGDKSEARDFIRDKRKAPSSWSPFRDYQAKTSRREISQPQDTAKRRRTNKIVETSSPSIPHENSTGRRGDKRTTDAPRGILSELERNTLPREIQRSQPIAIPTREVHLKDTFLSAENITSTKISRHRARPSLTLDIEGSLGSERNMRDREDNPSTSDIARKSYSVRGDKSFQRPENQRNIFRVEILTMTGDQITELSPGKYEYVIPKYNKDILLLRKSTSDSSKGHTSLVEHGEEVYYAGTITIGSDKRLLEWDNWSGHYIPDSPSAVTVGLPIDKFKSVSTQQRERDEAAEIENNRAAFIDTYINSNIDIKQLNEILNIEDAAKRKRAFNPLVTATFQRLSEQLEDDPKWQHYTLQKKQVQSKVAAKLQELKDAREHPPE